MIKLFTKKRKGFTLIELIVVIAILGILAAIAIPRLGGFRRDATASADAANAAVIYRAATAYFAANGDLVGFDVTEYVEQDVEYTGGEVNEEGTGITPVTVNGQTYPEEAE